MNDHPGVFSLEDAYNAALSFLQSVVLSDVRSVAERLQAADIILGHKVRLTEIILQYER